MNGIYVVDGVVGDYLCEKYQDLARQPLTIHMKNNRITEVFSENKELEQEFWAYTHTDENSDLVGEFAIGTNIELKHVIGQILQDEKFPGIHIAFGNPYGEHTGADWYSSTHIDVVGTHFDIWVDGRQIMEKGPLPHRGLSDDSRAARGIQPQLHAREVPASSCRALDRACGTHIEFPRLGDAVLRSQSRCSIRWRSTAASWSCNWSTIPKYRELSDVTVPAAIQRAQRIAAADVRAGGLRPGARSRAASWSRSWSSCRPSLLSTDISRLSAQQYIESYGLSHRSRRLSQRLRPRFLLEADARSSSSPITIPRTSS